MRKLGRIEDEELKKKRELFKEKYKWGRWYIPWASYYWKMGRKARRPELGIMALKNEEDQRCTHDQKDEVIVKHMKKMSAKRNEDIEEIDPNLRWNKVEKETSDGTLNQEITSMEVQLAMGKLKKQ